MLSVETNEYLTRVGPGTPMGQLFRSFWLPFLFSKELPEPDCPPVRVRLLGEDLVAFRETNGKVGLIDAHCPHRLAPMFFGRNEECGLRCVYHGWKFDTEGKCVDMPNEPERSNFKHKIQIKAYPTVERGGLIWAYMGAENELPEMPDLEFLLVPENHTYASKFMVEANYMQAMEGDIDSSHVSFLHSTPDNKFTGGGGGIVRSDRLVKFWIENKNPEFFVKEHDHGLLIGARRNAGEDTNFWRITHWFAPGYTIVPAEVGNPILCNIRVPIDDEQSWHIRIMWHPERPLNETELNAFQNVGVMFPELIPGQWKTKANKSNDYLIDREEQKTKNYTGIKAVTVQDMAMFEGMGTIIDRSKEHLGTSDTAIIQVRRILIRMAENLEKGKIPSAARNGKGYKARSASIEIPKNIEFEEGAKEYLTAQKWGL